MSKYTGIYRFTESKLWIRTVDWTRYLFGRETRDQAWIDGSNHCDAEWREYMLEKEAWIERCEGLITELGKALTLSLGWHYVSEEAREEYRNHI